MRLKIKHKWIRMSELKPPKNWVLPFQAEYEGKLYNITGADYPAQEWRAEEIE